MYSYLVISLTAIIIFPGKNPTDDYLEGMMNEAPGPINFTMFLTLFGDRLQVTDLGLEFIYLELNGNYYKATNFYN